MNRRQLIGGLVALAAGGALGWRGHRRAEERRRQDARMRADFADGNVHIVDGWMVSEYEVETLGLDGALPLAGAP